MVAGKVAQGVNRRQQALRGGRDLWIDLHRNVPALAAYHGVPVEVARTLAPLVAAGKDEEVVRLLLAHPEWYWIWILLYGGRGSSKTFTIALRSWTFAASQPGLRLLVVRKRKEQLRNTFLDEYEKVGKIITDDHLDYLGEIQPERDGALEYLVHTSNPKEPSRILFAIEPDQATDKDIMERWKGYNLHAAVTEETPQLKEITVHTTRSCVRVRADSDGKPVRRWMATLTNPVKPQTWLGKFKAGGQVGLQMMNGDYKGAAYLKKRPACLFIHSTPADNAHHLSEGYIEEQTEALHAVGRDDLVESWIHGRDEIEIKGMPVYGAQMGKNNSHVDAEIRYNPFKPLLRGWDFGYRHPACVFVQEDDKGCLNVLGEMMGENETADQFSNRVLTHCQENFQNPPTILDYGDPAGAQQTDKGDTTLFILRRKGIRVNFRVTSIEAGVKHIQGLLSRMRSGRPELMFSPAAHDLIDAFNKGYHYLQYHDGTFGRKPHKDGYYEHLCDAIRYLLVNVRALPDAEQSDSYHGKPIMIGGMEPAGFGESVDD